MIWVRCTHTESRASLCVPVPSAVWFAFLVGQLPIGWSGMMVKEKDQ